MVSQIMYYVFVFKDITDGAREIIVVFMLGIIYE